MKNSFLNRLILTALAISMTGGLYAQANVDSPYSMFGLGQVRNKTMNARLKGMGGVANAMYSKNMVNAENPASYAMIDTLAFLFDASVYAKSSTFSTTAMSENASCATFDYVSMGFAPTRWWKVAVGVQPYSSVGYNVVTSFNDAQLGSYEQAFQGEGGLNQVFMGNAFRLGNHFAVGANVNYVFGDSKSTTTLSFPDSTYVICSRRSRDVMISSFMFDYGLMYHGKLNDDLTLGVGLTYKQKINLRGNQTVYVRSVEAGINESNSIEYVIDTIVYQKDNNARYALPHALGFGVSLHKDNRWTLGVDFDWADWSSFMRNDVSEPLQDSWSVAVGGEYIPSSNSLSNYWTRVSYRLGGFFEQTYLNINGTSINKLGVTAGVTLPMPRSQSRVNLGLEIGKCGTKSANLIQENYINLTVGVSIFERWFVKRKYN